MKNHPTQLTQVNGLNVFTHTNLASGFNATFFSLSADPMCVLSMEGILININPAFVNTLGYTEEEVTGEKLIALVHPADVEQTRIESQILFEGKNMVRHQNRIRKKDGSFCWLEWTSTLFSEQNFICAIGKDCTEQKAYQQLLENANRQNTTILESITEGFFIMDADWTVTYWNRQAELLLDISKSEIINRSLWDVFPEEKEKTFYKQYHQAFAKQKTAIFEEYLARTGQWLEVTVFPSPGGLTVYFKDVTDRKERETALAEMNRQLKAITKASFGAIWEFDISTQTYFLHDENFKELFGYDYVNQPVEAQQWIEFLHPEDRERVMGEAMQIIQQGIEFSTLHYRVQKSNGEMAYVVARAFLMKAPNGMPYKLIGCIEDITAQKLAEMAIMESEEKYKSLFHNAPLPQWICDMETYRVLDVNQAAITHYGYAKDEFLNMSILALRPEEEEERIVKIIESNQNKQQRTNWGTAIHKKKDGTLMTVEIQTTQVPYNGRPTWLCTINDITEKEQAKEQIQKSKNDYKKLFRSAPLPQVIYNLQTFKFVKVNEAAIRHYGYSREEFLSMSIFDLRPQDECEKLKVYVEQMRSSNLQRISTWTHLKKNGERITVEATAIKIDYEDQDCVLVSFHDRTEKLKLEEKLLNLRVAAQRKITKAQIKAQEQQRELIGRELHDNVNQLLTTSKLYLGLARANEEMRVELISKSEGILLTAIEEIRTLSKSLASPVLQDAGFFAAFKELVDSYLVAQPFAIHTNYQETAAVDSLSAEAKLTFYRILQEQLTNIIKYAAAKNVWIDFDYLEGKIYLIIKDDGNGFDTSKKRHGVGLNNIKNRLELFNGSMSIESRPGEGCSLHVLFPVDNLSEMAHETTIDIFVAEDDEDDQFMLQQGFEKVNPNHRLTFVKNGADLLTALNQLATGHLPQLIILDYNMPVKNGLDTLQVLQVHQRYQSIPKIIYSTSPYEQHKAQCLSAHATAYIEKGLMLEEIEENVKQILSYCS